MTNEHIITSEDQTYFMKLIESLIRERARSNAGDAVRQRFMESRKGKKGKQEWKTYKTSEKGRSELETEYQKQLSTMPADEYEHFFKQSEIDRFIDRFNQYRCFIIRDVEAGKTKLSLSGYEAEIQREKRRREEEVRDRTDIPGLWEKYGNEIQRNCLETFSKDIADGFETRTFEVRQLDFSNYYTRRFREKNFVSEPLCADNLYDFLDMFSGSFNEWGEEGDSVINDMIKHETGYREDEVWLTVDGCLSDAFYEQVLPVARQIAPELSDDDLSGILDDEIMDQITTNSVLSDLQGLVTRDFIFSHLKKNPHYTEMFAEVERRNAEREKVREGLVDKIPDHYVDLYPAARNMKRHFILCLGPTNSGKTYTAVQALHQAHHGIYLAPLRLLAYEQYESLNAEGISCSMVTGEEQLKNENARVISSTIEMMDLNDRYDTAVIDEAQMISDEFRGGAWTQAVLGIQADTIYVCGAPYAGNILIRMIEDCGDTYEVRHFARKTPLIFKDGEFHIEDDLQKGDALIVFSRRSVYSLAMIVQKLGFRSSIIYGSLPYTIRHQQAQLFLNGRTDIVISTDAIGMGMNLPIKRIIFMECRKYDGKDFRLLTCEEVQQIAGRAGRYGICDAGMVLSSERTMTMQAKLKDPPAEIRRIRMSFPVSLLGIDAPVSVILKQWQRYHFPERWIWRQDITEIIDLAKEAEKSDLRKRDVFEISSIPFDHRNQMLLSVWRLLLSGLAQGSAVDAEEWYQNSSFKDIRKDVDACEQNHKLCDLLYAYDERFNDGKHSDFFITQRQKISEMIHDLLQEHIFPNRRCRVCGKILPWNYPWSMCEECHDEMYQRRLSLDEDPFEDDEDDDL